MTVTRFAPSPTGYLHEGHAFSALFAAASCGPNGRFLLRIEDIDATRCRPAFEAAIYEDLAWLGLTWETPVRRQSEHFADYRAAIDRLEGQGLLYPCFCTRKEIAAEIAASAGAPQGPDGPLYPGTCRSLSEADRAARIAAGTPYALRLDMAEAARRAGPLTRIENGVRHIASPDIFGDVILARKETPASYHLAVTVDDALQGVTLVTRGEDLAAAASLHRLLQVLLGLPEPHWHHHKLLTDTSGKRLAKRDNATPLAELRARGISPGDLRARLGFA
jgi:glutamyl-Q tRNA(Asp) synthetase